VRPEVVYRKTLYFSVGFDLPARKIRFSVCSSTHRKMFTVNRHRIRARGKLHANIFISAPTLDCSRHVAREEKKRNDQIRQALENFPILCLLHILITAALSPAPRHCWPPASFAASSFQRCRHPICSVLHRILLPYPCADRSHLRLRAPPLMYP
jgi:hypothetical protein